MNRIILKFLNITDQLGKRSLRAGLVLVFVWIGFLKFYNYEAEGIVPFVANSPFMDFFYSDPREYTKYWNREGEVVKANHDWHIKNNTYRFSHGLGVFLVIVAIMVALHKPFPLVALVGGGLMFIMTIGTLSFLFTTPECWVSDYGGPNGFPLLSARGRLVIKDVLIMAGSVIAMGESAQHYLKSIELSQKYK